MQYLSTLALHPQPNYAHRVCVQVLDPLGLHMIASGSDTTGQGYLYTPGSLPAVVALRSLEEALESADLEEAPPNLEHLLERGLHLANRRLHLLAREFEDEDRAPLTYEANGAWVRAKCHEASPGEALGVVFRQDRVSWSNVGHGRLYRLRAGRLEELTRDYAPPELAQLLARHPNLLLQALGQGPKLTPDTGSAQVAPGDRYLIHSCSFRPHSEAITRVMADPTQTHAQLRERLFALDGLISERSGVILVDADHTK